MSFLSSVLRSISKGDDAAPSPASKAPQPPPSSKARSVASNTAIAGVKRKAETELQSPAGKSQKTTDGKSARDIKPLPQRSNTAPTAVSTTKTYIPSKSTGQTQSNGAKKEAAPLVSGGSRSSVPERKPAGPSKPSTSTGIPTKPNTGLKKTVSTAKPGTAGQGGVANPSQGQAQPKKGSFKDLLARAQAAQTVAVGKILHKPTEKMSKRERMALAKGKPVKGKEAQPVGTAAKTGGQEKIAVGRDGKTLKTATASSNTKYQGTSKPKTPAKPAYAGTAKPSGQAAFKGTAKPNTASKYQGNAKPARRADRNEYLGTDEEDEGEYGYDSEDQYYENSDDFSDMDAGFDEIGDEELEAERQAKYDDMKEQKLLEKMAREKEERKKGRS